MHGDFKPRRAFTLVELLVVIGIIAVLTALLLAAAGKAREHASRIKCAANLHSIGQALTLYTQLYGCYPACYGFPTTVVDVAIWPVRLRTFLNGKQEVFYCPAQDERCRWLPGDVKNSTHATPIDAVFGYQVGEPLLAMPATPSRFFSYGYDGGVGSGGWGLGDFATTFWNTEGELKANRVKNPAEMIAIGDSKANGQLDGQIDMYVDSSITGVGLVHSHGANFLFCDGHVEWCVPPDWRSLGNEHLTGLQLWWLRMWNFDNEPRMGLIIRN